MSFARIINKKQILAIVLLTGLIMLVPSTATAQQQTGQVAPQTRNPQTNAPELFPQRDGGGLQPTGVQNLLQQQPRRIQIPQGVPAQPENGQDDSPRTLRWTLLILASFIALAVSVILFKKSRQIKDANKTPASIPEPVDIPRPVVAEAVIKKKKNPKKKRSKGKPRPKKK